MPDKIKRMNIKEFRKEGYLQEANRQFFHPLGLALEIIIEENGEEKLGGIWDFRDDPEGIHFDIKNSTKERKEEMKIKADNVRKQLTNKLLTRRKALGFGIEPLE
ncbi:MAG: hypothetical protein ACOC22_04550 [bacterium]